MAKSIKLKNNTYWDARGIVVNRKLLSDKLGECSMTDYTGMNNRQWQKICNVKFDYHAQGQFAFIKILIGYGNNGQTNQNAYIDLFMQLGWTGSDSGRAGCNAELHPLQSPFTTSNTGLKVIANSNTNYDIWFKSINEQYCKPNYIANVTNQTLVTPKSDHQDSEPTGTACNLSYVSV